MRKSLVVITLFSALGMLAQAAQKPPDAKSTCPPCGGDLQHCYAVLPPGKPVHHRRHVAVKPKQRPVPMAQSAPPPMPAAMPPAMPCCFEKPLETWANAQAERADTDQKRLNQVEVPAQNTNQYRAETERMLVTAKVAKINAEAGLLGEKAATEKALLPFREKATQANTKLVTMQAGYLKHDHLWQLGYHAIDGTAFGMGEAFRNVAGINVNQTGAASVSNSGNNTSNANATGGNSSSTSSSKSDSSSSSSSASQSDAGASASASAPDTGGGTPQQ